MGVCGVLIVAPFVHVGFGNDVGIGGVWYAVGAGIVLGGGVGYWYVWTIVIPKYKGYTLETREEVLSDGTGVSRLVKVYK